MSKTIILKEQFQVWGETKYEVDDDFDREEYLEDLSTDKVKPLSKVIERQWNTDSVKVIGVKLEDGDLVEISSAFDWTLCEWPDQQELYNAVVRKMHRGICQFSYETIGGGKVRIAFGTMNRDVIPFGKSDKPVSVSSRLTTPQSYWDLELNDWRSFVPTHLITTV